MKRKNKPTPPRWITRLFQWYCNDHLSEAVLGDLIEMYERRRMKMSKRRADLFFLWNILSFVQPFAIKRKSTTLNNSIMVRSYFKLGWRNLIKNKGYSLINIGGLSLGMTIAILIGLWISDELSFNHAHANFSTIAQVYRKETKKTETFTSIFQTTGLAALLKTDYSSYFERVVIMNTRTQEVVLASGDNKFTQIGYFMQPDGVDMFSVKILSGDGRELKNKNSILLSRTLADKIFGDQDPIDQVVSMDARRDLKVAAVYEDLPGNSEFKDATFFAPIEIYTGNLDTWDNYNVRIYVQMKDGHTPEATSSLIKTASKSHLLPDQQQELFLHPMSKWHLSSEFKNGVEVTSSSLLAVWYYGLIGVFVLILACINFMNLSTARSGKRAKEVGIRKTIGSFRSQLVQQFYSESLIVSLLAFVVALLLAYLSLPWFGSIAGKDISMPWSNPLFWLAGFGFIIVTSLLAGSYPMLYLSSFKPVFALKGQHHPGKFALSSRRMLVVFQFTISVVLTICTLVVYLQIKHAKERPIGYSREHLISLRAASPEFRGKYDVLRNKLKATGVVEEMAESNYAITETLGSNDGFSWQGNIYDQSFNTITVTPEYGKTVDWELIAGRDFSRDIASDSAGVILNESAWRVLGILDPVGETLQYKYFRNGPANFKILGVVKDMVKGSPYAPTVPSIIFPTKADLFWLYVRLNSTSNPHTAIQQIATVFEEVVPSAPFDFRFADAEYDAKFKSEERIEDLATVFTFFAFLISTLGLVGLAAFSAERRAKEFGIRKVLGASALNLWELITREFLLLVAVACLLAIPFAYYFMSSWLLQYDYRIEIPTQVYLVPSVAMIAVTLLTVSMQSIKVVLTNPVKSLRSE